MVIIMIVEIQKEFFSIDQCMENPTKLYIFGDNVRRVGRAGQAVIRDCRNSYGIATKLLPSVNSNAFFRDNSDYHKKIIEDDLTNLRSLTTKYDIVTFPRDGIGTGLSQMPHKCPSLFRFLSIRLYEIFGIKLTYSGFSS